jgi:hypothetical protein
VVADGVRAKAAPAPLDGGAVRAALAARVVQRHLQHRRARAGARHAPAPAAGAGGQRQRRRRRHGGGHRHRRRRVHHRDRGQGRRDVALQPLCRACSPLASSPCCQSQSQRGANHHWRRRVCIIGRDSRACNNSPWQWQLQDRRTRRRRRRDAKPWTGRRGRAMPSLRALGLWLPAKQQPAPAGWGCADSGTSACKANAFFSDTNKRNHKSGRRGITGNLAGQAGRLPGQHTLRDQRSPHIVSIIDDQLTLRRLASLSMTRKNTI